MDPKEISLIREEMGDPSLKPMRQKQKDLNDSQLYGFVDTAYLHGRQPASIAKALCEGGADLIQWRAKDWTPEQVESEAREILKITRDHHVPLVINDHLRVALELGADFCHLGQEDFFDGGYQHVSDLPTHGVDIGIGLSTHAPDQARRALAAEPDYIAIGPVYKTDTKPTARPVTLDYVRWASQNTGPVPWFAIGGINEQTLNAVLDAGATRVCIVSAILNATDTLSRCAEFVRMIQLRLQENEQAMNNQPASF